MKFFIVGLHGSGKKEVVDILKQLEIPVGKLFSDLEQPSVKIYNSYDYELFTTKEVNEIFENNAYVFLQKCYVSGSEFYEGLTRYEFDNNDVFVLSPDQLISVSFTNIKEPYCFIWMDNTKNSRFTRYKEEKRGYDFSEREKQESQDMGYFVSILYGSVPTLYFNNDDPARVATIVYTLDKHPELIELYKQTFNS